MNLADIARLEQLDRLRSTGALTAEEFESAKARLFAEVARQASPAASGTVNAPVIDQREPRLSPTWRYRFDFYDRHGLLDAVSRGPGYRAQPWPKRMRLNASFLGFFLGPIYLLILGLWRPAITIICSVVLVWLFIGGSALDGNTTDKAIGAGVGGLCSIVAGPLYYLKVRRGVHSWNPLVWWRG